MLKVKSFYLVIVVLIGLVAAVSSQDLPVIYNAKVSTGGKVSTVCPATHDHDLRENITQDIRLLVKSSILPSLTRTENIGPGYGACGCGGPGWRRAAYLNMSDPTQTCPPAWELITTPRRSCARPSSAGGLTCYSAMFPTQVFNTLRSVEESLDIRLDNHKLLSLKIVIAHNLLMVHMLTELV